MKKASVTMTYDEEKLNAIRLFFTQKNLDFDAELKGFLDSLFKKSVPVDVRRFLEMKQGGTPLKPPVTTRKADNTKPNAE